MKFILEDREWFMKGGEFDKKKIEILVRKVREEIVKGRFVKFVGLKFGFVKYKLILIVDGLD